MKEEIIPECFWEIDGTHVETCNCSKIFFDVYIDFELTRLVFCKNLYAQYIKNLMHDIEINDEISNMKGQTMYRYHVCDYKYAQQVFIRYFIKRYFKTPIIDKIKMDNEVSNHVLWNSISNKLYQPIYYPICERPFISVKIDMLKTLELYVFNKEFRFNYKFRELINSICEKLLDMSKKIFTANKYIKLRGMIKKLSPNYFYLDSSKENLLIDIFTELLKEMSNLKITKL